MASDKDVVNRIRAAIQQLEGAMREAEALRDDINRTRKQSAYWPDRRVPRHWSRHGGPPSDDEPPPDESAGR
jgi:hypothetical protein